MAIRVLPAAPTRYDDPDTFIAKTDAWMAAIPGWTSDANALAGTMGSYAAGGAYAIPCTIRSTSAALAGAVGTAGGGSFAFTNNGGTLLIDVKDARGALIDAALLAITNSTSSVRGSVRFVKQNDPTVWSLFDITTAFSYGASGLYLTCGVSVKASSASGFNADDPVMLFFQRTGDKGDAGQTASLNRRVYSIASDTAPSITTSNYDMMEITALAGNIIIGAPSGTATNGQSLMYRIRDNGTARTIAFNGIYRAPAELAFPAITQVGKWTYLGFVYNATDAKWDLVAAISAM